MLAKLLNRMDRERFKNVVVSLTDRGQLGAEIEEAGTPVYCLGMKRGRVNINAVARLVRLIRDVRPGLIQSWLYHADLLCLVASKFAGSPPIVWNLRCSNMDLQYYPRKTRWVLRVLARCSRLPVAVIVNSLAGQALHQHLGYRVRRWEVIPNGFDLDQFRPDPEAKGRLCGELRVPADSLLVGMIARVDPMKDHGTFLDAASLLADKYHRVHFVLVGKDALRLRPLVVDRHIERCVHLFDSRRDISRILPGLDIVSLSSAFGEGFPNAVGEAMATGIPCVVTNVGDSARLVGETGRVVPTKNPEALARAWGELIEMGSDGRHRLGLAARQRIEEHFDLRRIVKQYEQCYEALAACSASTFGCA